MLDGVIEYMPAPTEVKPIEGILEDDETVETASRQTTRRLLRRSRSRLPQTRSSAP